jgi:cobalt-precorrin 5A hydrolase / precorrin-3B C17-methyltransferase
VGLDSYVERIRGLLRPGTRVAAFPIGAELERARLAVAEAAAGAAVALVSGGDAGVYGMASPALAAAPPEVEVIGVPGVSAALAAAALLGAPLGHDHCAISLSDLRTPWPEIRRKLEAAAAGDFVIALYNPRSAGREWQLDAARRLLLEYRKPETPVGLVTDAYRPGQRIDRTTLGELDPSLAGMTTTVVIGSSRTRMIAGRMVTPRGYEPEDSSGHDGSKVLQNEPEIQSRPLPIDGPSGQPKASLLETEFGSGEQGSAAAVGDPEFPCDSGEAGAGPDRLETGGFRPPGQAGAGHRQRVVHPIESQSYRILRSLINVRSLGPLSRAVAERVVHASADPAYAEDLVLDEVALTAGLAALRAGAPIVVDARMVAAAITARPIICALDLTDPPTAAEGTRAAAGVRAAVREVGSGAVWVVGCAPTALEALLAVDARPALVIGLPVGFVGAVEAKRALVASGLPAVTNRGVKGGSAVAAAALNALLYWEGPP